MISSFQEYFPNINPSLFSNQNIRQINYNSNIFLTFSIFINLSTFNSGGAIYLEHSNNNILMIESCLFKFCSSFSKGGAISFICTNSDIVTNKLCGYSCFTGNSGNHLGGQFIYVITSKRNEHFNSMITECSSFQDDNWQTISLQGGNIKFDNQNCSNNKVYAYSGPLFYSANSAISKYLTVYGCSSTSHTQIGVVLCPSNIQYINIINNHSPNYGIFHYNSNNHYIENSFMYNNSGCIFDIYSATLTVSNSIINNYSISRGSVNTINVTTNQIYSIEIFHFNNCYNKDKTKSLKQRFFLLKLFMNLLLINL